MLEYLQAIILIFIEALCCIIFFDNFFEKRFSKTSKRKSVWIERGLFLILCVFFYMFATIFNDKYIIKTIAIVTTIVLVMFGVYNGKILQILFLSVVYYGFVLLIDRVLIIFVLHVMNSNIKDLWSDPIRTSIISLLAKNILFLWILFIKRRFNVLGNFSFITDIEWVRFLFFPLISIISMTAFAVERDVMGNDVLIVSFGLIFLNFLVFFMIQDIIKGEREKREIQLSNERTKNQILMYEYMEGVYDEQRKQLHDFKNHMACLQGLLEENAYIAASEYLRIVNDGWIDETNYINVNHPIVNSVLNQKYKQAHKKGIAMVMLVNNLNSIPMKDEDIVIILSNLLDNAIEACEKVTLQSKIIRVRFWYEDNSIFISTKNPVDNPPKMINGKIYTTKTDDKTHGIGLGNIKSVVEKYGGEDIYSCENGYFTHSVIVRDNIF